MPPHVVSLSGHNPHTSYVARIHRKVIRGVEPCLCAAWYCGHFLPFVLTHSWPQLLCHHRFLLHLSLKRSPTSQDSSLTTLPTTSPKKINALLDRIFSPTHRYCCSQVHDSHWHTKSLLAALTSGLNAVCYLAHGFLHLFKIVIECLPGAGRLQGSSSGKQTRYGTSSFRLSVSTWTSSGLSSSAWSR